jgi:hypothetical protein
MVSYIDDASSSFQKNQKVQQKSTKFRDLQYSTVIAQIRSMTVGRSLHKQFGTIHNTGWPRERR